MKVQAEVSLYNALREGFKGLARQTDVVVDVKISNACPDAVSQGHGETERTSPHGNISVKSMKTA